MNLLSFMAGMFNPGTFLHGYVGSAYRQSRIHATKKGPGRSVGMKHKQKTTGRKLTKKAFEGMIGLRNGIGAAGRIAQQNNWGS